MCVARWLTPLTPNYLNLLQPRFFTFLSQDEDRSNHPETISVLRRPIWSILNYFCQTLHPWSFSPMFSCGIALTFMFSAPFVAKSIITALDKAIAALIVPHIAIMASDFARTTSSFHFLKTLNRPRAKLTGKKTSRGSWRKSPGGWTGLAWWSSSCSENRMKTFAYAFKMGKCHRDYYNRWQRHSFPTTATGFRWRSNIWDEENCS